MSGYDLMYGDLITYSLVIIGFLIVLYAQLKINTNYNKYKKVKASTGIDGATSARKILEKHGLDLYVVETSGNLTDHYDPKGKVVRLSREIYRGDTIAGIAVAAHECGHAIQDQEGYIFMRIRSTLVPVVNLISYLGYFSIFISIFTGVMGYLMTGIVVILATLLFQLVTLPVEFDASRRGLKEIKELCLLSEDEYKGASNVLKAAAFTYVAGTISTLLQLLRLILMFNRRRD